MQFTAVSSVSMQYSLQHRLLGPCAASKNSQSVHLVIVYVVRFNARKIMSVPADNSHWRCQLRVMYQDTPCKLEKVMMWPSVGRMDYKRELNWTGLDCNELN